MIRSADDDPATPTDFDDQRPADLIASSGKTHLAVGSARAISDARPPDLATVPLATTRAALEGRLGYHSLSFVGHTMSVVDGLGYLPLPVEATSALLQDVS